MKWYCSDDYDYLFHSINVFNSDFFQSFETESKDYAVFNHAEQQLDITPTADSVSYLDQLNKENENIDTFTADGYLLNLI